MSRLIGSSSTQNSVQIDAYHRAKLSARHFSHIDSSIPSQLTSRELPSRQDSPRARDLPYLRQAPNNQAPGRGTAESYSVIERHDIGHQAEREPDAQYQEFLSEPDFRKEESTFGNVQHCDKEELF